MTIMQAKSNRVWVSNWEDIKSIGTVTNHSGTITTGGASQLAVPENLTRKYLLVQNVSDEAMWIMFGTNAIEGQPSMKLLPNGSYVMESTFISSQPLYIIGATTGKEFSIWEG